MRWIAKVRAALSATAMAAIFCFGSTQAQTLVEGDGWSFDSDVLFLKYGNSKGFDNDDVFDFESGIRLALTRIGDSDVGVRMTWFQWEHEGTDGAVRAGLDTYNLDLEVLKRIEIGDRTVMELTGGVRHNDTNSFFPTTFEPNNFLGWGGIVGVRGGVRVRENGMLYARGKTAILMGEGFHDANNAPTGDVNDVIRNQTELALGYEHRFQLGAFTIVPRTGFESQYWDGFLVDSVDEHPESDIGLLGFVGGVGITY